VKPQSLLVPESEELGGLVYYLQNGSSAILPGGLQLPVVKDWTAGIQCA